MLLQFYDPVSGNPTYAKKDTDEFVMDSIIQSQLPLKPVLLQMVSEDSTDFSSFELNITTKDSNGVSFGAVNSTEFSLLFSGDPKFQSYKEPAVDSTVTIEVPWVQDSTHSQYLWLDTRVSSSTGFKNYEFNFNIF